MKHSIRAIRRLDLQTKSQHLHTCLAELDKNHTCRGWVARIDGRWKIGGYHYMTKHPNKLKHHNLNQDTFDL